MSGTVIIAVREVDLIISNITLLSGGTAKRKAWGKIIRRIIVAFGSPQALAASHCPLSTEAIAERKISEI